MMEKKIEDYLPLYIGQDVQITTSEAVFQRTMIGFYYVYYDIWPTKKRVPTVQVKEPGKDILCNYWQSSQVKLILRPLSDMTGAEGDEMENLSLSCPDLSGCPRLHPAQVINNQKPEIMRYLLSRGFDLFGLKESGLAVYK